MSFEIFEHQQNSLQLEKCLTFSRDTIGASNSISEYTEGVYNMGHYMTKYEIFAFLLVFKFKSDSKPQFLF